ncbi:MAG: hypothetical protein C0631_16500 [Sedimenticola sp.]|nr:MAG: hypothetical protein C0631_16500 [Sedimenticola sp.]
MSCHCQKSYGVCSIVLALVVTLCLGLFSPGAAFAESFFPAEKVIELGKVRDHLRDNPEMLTDEHKLEILEAINREFGTLNPSFAPLTDPVNHEFLAIVVEMIGFLETDAANTEGILRKLYALDLWFKETSELAKVFRQTGKPVRRAAVTPQGRGDGPSAEPRAEAASPLQGPSSSLSIGREGQTPLPSGGRAPSGR